MKVIDKQLALLQCPQCDGWFIDSSARRGEACPSCFEGYTPPDTKREGDKRCQKIQDPVLGAMSL